MSLKKYFRRHVYRWHRITSLLVAVPILLWTISGFLHPVMGLLKPYVPNSYLPGASLDSARLTVPLQSALKQNGINTFRKVRMVKLYKGYYYQVAQAGIDSLTYVNCESGRLLKNGDRLYAGYLAQRYLFEKNVSQKENGHRHHQQGFHQMSLTRPDLVSTKRSTPENYKITATILLTSFTRYYKKSNKLLPVYEVAFDREDGIRLYIETASDRLALASDHNKRRFTTFFAVTHSWSFLDNWGKAKSVVLGSFSTLCFLSCVFGFAVYNVLNKKKPSANASKRWHRWLGNVFLVTTLLYAFSGAWHAFAKIPEKPTTSNKAVSALWQSSELAGSISPKTLFAGEEKITGLSLVKINENKYWRVIFQKGKEKSCRYISLTSDDELKNGDETYARELACAWKGVSPASVVKTTRLTSFTNRYSMMNKRLPVWETAFTDGTNYYVETATTSLAAVSMPSDGAERFSFSNLHMHHYWEMWLGKETGKQVKNLVMFSSTLGLLLLTLTGILLYLSKKQGKRPMVSKT
ncbi:PepSY domain-containing protein [Flavisolibacter sp. BT320]|nr:PepSY domain-containing protein [Flavisolibacter longurius]